MRKIWIAVALLSLAYAGWRAAFAPRPTKDNGEALFYNRAWADRLPESERETANIFAAIRKKRTQLGLFTAHAQWKRSLELFRYEPRSDGRAILEYPHTGERHEVRYRAYRCDEDGFDYCLDLEGTDRGVKHYRSLDDWEIEAADDETTLSATIAHKLATAHKR